MSVRRAKALSSAAVYGTGSTADVVDPFVTVRNLCEQRVALGDGFTNESKFCISVV